MGADLEWQNRKACGDLDPNDIDPVFFPHPNSDAAEAKAICITCPVAEQCLVYAIESKQEFGVWGGTTEHERGRLFRPARLGGLPDAKCGTESGYRRHTRAGEKSCDACRTAARAARALREAKAS